MQKWVYWIPLLGSYLPNNPYPNISSEQIGYSSVDSLYYIWHVMGIPAIAVIVIYLIQSYLSTPKIFFTNYLFPAFLTRS